MEEREYFTGTIKYIKGGGILITVDEVEEDIWFPTSQIETTEYLEIGNLIEFSIPEWLAIEKELV